MVENEKFLVLGINDSGGTRIQEGIGALAGLWRDFLPKYNGFWCYSSNFCYIRSLCRWNSLFSSSYGLCFVVENISKMFITGPNVVESVLGEG